MSEKEINDLLDLGYTMAQISQLIKLKNDGILIKLAFNWEKAKLLIVKDADEYRDFRTAMLRVNFNDAQKEHFFKAFIDGLDYILPIDAEMCGGSSAYILTCLRDIKEKELNIDITPMLNKNYSSDFLNQIWRDLRDGVDVKVYLNSELSSKKKEILREGLLKGVNIESDLKDFSFLGEDDIPNLVTLIKSEYDYKSILKKFKNTKKTVFICEIIDEHKINPLEFLNAKMSYEVIVDLCNRAVRGEDVKFFKSIQTTNVSSIPLFIKIYKSKFPIKKVKNCGERTLTQVIAALDAKLTHEQIDTVLGVNYYPTMSLLINCYKYKQDCYIDFLKEHEGLFMMDYDENIKKLLKYNYENKENPYELKELILSEGKPVPASVFSFYVKLITEIGVDRKMFELLKDNKYSLKQSRIIVSAYKAGYDISCMLDRRLSETQLQSIKNCMDLGLTITKNKEYDLPENNEPIYDEERSHVRYFDKDSYYYEIEDYDGRCRIIEYYDNSGW